MAKSLGQNHELVKRWRAFTLGFLTPFYLIRAGSFVDLTSLLGGLFPFFLFFVVANRFFLPKHLVKHDILFKGN